MGFKEEIEEWVASPAGKIAIRDTAEKVRNLVNVAEQKRRDDAVWIAEYSRKPTTI